MAQVQLYFDDLDDDALPDVCMKCGAPAVAHKLKTFAWHPPWVIVLMLFGLLPYVLVALVLTKRRKVNIPFCEAHENHWRWRLLFTLGSFAVPVLLIIGAIAAASSGANDLSGILLICGFIGLPVWLIAVAVVYATAISVANITDDHITLRNVGREFVLAYKESGRDDFGRYGRHERGRREEDRDARVRPPGAPRPPNDVYEKG